MVCLLCGLVCAMLLSMGGIRVLECIIYIVGLYLSIYIYCGSKSYMPKILGKLVV